MPGPQLDVHREVFGFEKAFLDGRVSVGLRAPVLQQEGDSSFAADDLGDLTALFKAVVAGEPNADLLSAGLAVTAPTGPSVPTVARDVHSTLLQPFVGYVWDLDRAYVEGFTSVAVPTDDHDVVLLFNDEAVGYWLYQGSRDEAVSGVVPALEVHVTTPLNHRGATNPITVPDTVVLTEGVHLNLFDRATLTVGAATPVTGPRPFDFEVMTQLNVRF